MASRAHSEPPTAVRALLYVDHGVTKAAEAFLIAIFAAFVFISFFQVVLRYVFHDTLAWADEFSRYAFIWSMFVGSALVIGKNFHITITLLSERLPAKFEIVWWALDMFITGCIAVVIFFYGWRIINLGWNTLTPASELPIAYYQMVYLVFGAIAMLRIVVEVFSRYYGIHSAPPTSVEVQVD